MGRGKAHGQRGLGADGRRRASRRFRCWCPSQGLPLRERAIAPHVALRTRRERAQRRDRRTSGGVETQGWGREIRGEDSHAVETGAIDLRKPLTRSAAIEFNIARVRKPLASAAKMAQNGNRVVLDMDGSYV